MPILGHLEHGEHGVLFQTAPLVAPLLRSQTFGIQGLLLHLSTRAKNMQFSISVLNRQLTDMGLVIRDCYIELVVAVVNLVNQPTEHGRAE